MIELSKKILELIATSRSRVAGYANFEMVVTYFEIGKNIVEEIQRGNTRADYGNQILKQVADDLLLKLGKGFSVQNLERMRNFYLVYSKSSIELRKSPIFEKSSNELRISEKDNKMLKILPLSWSHYLFLTRIENELERNFYEIEAAQNNWKLKDLERQFNSGLYERLTLSKNKEEILELATKGQKLQNPNDLFKEPYILEFLGLKENTSYSETDLETAIINEIEQFMLEMGKGFFFGGRQVRFTFDEDHYRIDLVFYNRLLQCFVLIDLKIGKLKHQDLGQMQMYVNYYDRYIKTENENKTIGIIICKDKNNALVEITLPENNNQIFASKYQTILPSKTDLQEIIKHYD
jgi:predicted nuclease of restriction endonuclease-like (RecB) superfamily